MDQEELRKLESQWKTEKWKKTTFLVLIVMGKEVLTLVHLGNVKGGNSMAGYTCGLCNGSGKVEQIVIVPAYNTNETKSVTCSRCNGTGEERR